MNSTIRTPILLITFNRPSHTRRVWEEIKKQRPKYLYVFQDGAREGNATDAEKCEQVRAIFDEPRDWECELKTFYSEPNMGCGPGPAAAITWFFENVEQGIIFEDDCLPSTSLFQFYAELLEIYKNDERVSLITANNLALRWKTKKNSYLFSTVGAATMGSWASWSRAWKYFDYNISSWNKEDTKRKMVDRLRMKRYFDYYATIFDENCNSTQTHAWDYQWLYARILRNTVSIVSSVNQLSNIGFDADGTHTSNPNDRLANLPVFTVDFPLKKSKFEIDKLFDWVVFNRYYSPKKKSFVMRLALKLIETVYCR